MTHFVVWVMIPEKDNIYDQVEELLDPFDENKSEEPYKEYIEGENLERMEKFYKTKNLKSLVGHIEDWSGNEGGLENGKLYYWSKYNPKSKWDWYEIGGRWTGSFDNYDPLSDKTNYSKCEHCQGTGTRKDMTSSERKMHLNPEKGFLFPIIGEGCNACQGTGMSLNFSWTNQGESDIKPVKFVLDYMNKFGPPVAMLLSDGTWMEIGGQHWFGIVENTDNKKSQSDWDLKVKMALSANLDKWVVLVDCHI